MNQLQCFGHFAAGMYGCCASGTHSHSACPPGTQALTDKDFIDPQTKQSILSSDLKISDFAGVLCDPSENAAVASSQYTICRPTTEWKCDKKKVHSGDRKALSQLTAALAHPNMLSLVACKTRKLECWSNQWSQFAADIRHPHWACCTDAGSACTQHTQLQSAKKLMSSLPSFGLLNGRLCDRGGSVCIAKHNSDCSEALQSAGEPQSKAHKQKKVYRFQGGHYSVPEEPSRQHIVDCKGEEYQCYHSEWDLWRKTVGAEPVWLCCTSESNECPKTSKTEAVIKNDIDRKELDYLVCGEHQQICAPQYDTHCTKQKSGDLRIVKGWRFFVNHRLEEELVPVQKSESDAFVDTSVFSDIIQIVMMDVVIVAATCALCCGLIIALVASYMYARNKDQKCNRYNMIHE